MGNAIAFFAESSRTPLEAKVRQPPDGPGAPERPGDKNLVQGRAMNPSRFAVEERDDALLIRFLDGHLLDRLLLNEVQDELAACIATHRPQVLLISFSSVRRFGSEAVNLLLKAQKAIAEYGGEVRLTDMGEDVHAVFKILRLDGDVFKIFACTDDALAVAS